MQDEDRAAWWAIWGMARCPLCNRLVTIGHAMNTPYFSTHPTNQFAEHPRPRCRQSGLWHASLAKFGVLDTSSDEDRAPG